MRLAAKLVSVAILAIVLVSAVNGYFRVGREVEQFHTDMRRDVIQLARATAEVVAEAWRHSGLERANAYVQRVNQAGGAVQVRIVWWDDTGASQAQPAVPQAHLAPLETGQYVSVEVRRPTGEGVLYTYAPLAVGSSAPCALEFSESLDDLDNYTYATVARVILHTLVMALLAAVGVLLYGMFVVGRPLNLLVDKVHRVGLGDLSEPLILHGHDELSKLASAINEMCRDLCRAQADIQREAAARLTAIEQLRHADRLKTVGRLASGMAHEMGTPLNVISGRASLLIGQKLSPEEAKQSAATIKSQADRITALVRQLLDFARRHTPRKEPVDVCSLVRQSMDLLRPQSLKFKAALTFEASEPSVICCVDAGQLQQVMVNLIVNAMQALDDGGTVSISVGVDLATPPSGSTGTRDRYVHIRCTDDGTGISAEHIQHLFEPFFTTKDVGQGTGLGLPIAYGIVQEHGGWIDVHSEPGRGSTFVVFLPWGAQTCRQES